MLETVEWFSSKWVDEDSNRAAFIWNAVCGTPLHMACRSIGAVSDSLRIPKISYPAEDTIYQQCRIRSYNVCSGVLGGRLTNRRTRKTTSSSRSDSSGFLVFSQSILSLPESLSKPWWTCSTYDHYHK